MFNNVRSKLARAIAAYLIAQGAGTAEDTSAANVTDDSTYPRTTVRPGIASPNPPLTGNYRIRVMISIKGSAVSDIGQNARVSFDTRVGAICDAMMNSDDSQTLIATAQGITAAGRALAIADDNADMSDFTCLDVYDAGFGEGEASSEGTSWEEVLLFDADCCGANVD